MILSVLNSALGQQTVVDGIFNFRWTEKYSEVSDFELEVPSTAYYRGLLKEDVILMIDESEQPMIIETVKIKKSGKSKHWIVQGRDLTSWMELRTSPYNRQIDGTRVSDIAASVINQQVINPSNPNDKFPNLLAVNNLATDGVKFDYESTNDDLLTDVQNVLNDNGCAIRCDRVGSMGSYSWRYRIYNGTRKNVKFSDKVDTLVNTQYIRSKKKWRNQVAVRYKNSNAENAPTLTRLVYSSGGGTSTTGLNRRTMQIQSSLNPSDYPGTRLLTAVDRLGRAALAKQKKIEAIDGEIPAYTPAKYGLGKDYYLGDLVKFNSDSTTSTEARVTAFTWVIDSTGFKKYPTIDITADVSV